jgi:hypothetical protein
MTRPEPSNARKGAIAEAAVAAEATRLGFDVYRPIAEGGRYDLIIDARGRLVRVQCKWARLLTNVVSVGLRSSRLSSRGYVRSTYDAAEIDGVAAYCGALDCCFWLPIEQFSGRTSVHLRLAAARNGQRQALNWAEQFPLGAIAQLGERVTGSHEVAGSSPASSIA